MSEIKTGSRVIPALRYRNPDAMIEWLCRVFSFEQHAIYRKENGTVVHAELRLGSGMIMLGAVDNERPSGAWFAQPEDVGGRETQSAYLVVKDCDAVYAAAAAAQATIVLDLKEEDYGGKSFTCRDPEGHVWSVGSYDPWTITKSET
jgi:uncharacterized glyoxalase superfamily protein PhnB